MASMFHCIYEIMLTAMDCWCQDPPSSEAAPTSTPPSGMNMVLGSDYQDMKREFSAPYVLPFLGIDSRAIA